MPGKLNIQNISLTEPVLVTIKGLMNGSILLDKEIYPPGKITNTSVKGGIKEMIVADTIGNVWFNGLIPSHTTIPVVIDPSHKRVLYDGNNVVNNLHNKEGILKDTLSKIKGLFSNKYYVIAIIILILLVLCLYFYYRKKK